MNLRNVLRVGTVLALVVGGAMVTVQGQLLPSGPKLGFGASVTPAYDGWYENPDGSFTYLIGYYNRNWTQELDIPIGPDNHFEPGEPDRGQPTHFMPNRNWGMFSLKLPKSTPATERVWWVLSINGVTSRVPFHRSPDFNITVDHSSEEAPNGKYNLPPILKFAEAGPKIQGPVASLASAQTKTATVNTPMPLDLWAEDDALYTSGTNAPMTRVPPVVEVIVDKYRGPGNVKKGGEFHFTPSKGGKPMEAFEGKASGTLTFDKPGDYIVHITLTDFSEKGGGATACCWTNAMIKVNVK
jgi:hypothetical protein